MTSSQSGVGSHQGGTVSRYRQHHLAGAQIAPEGAALLRECSSALEGLRSVPNREEFVGFAGSRAHDVLEAVDEHLQGYSRMLRLIGAPANRRDIMLEDLHFLTEKLGHVPRAEDVREACQNLQCASFQRYEEEFGSWDGALTAANILESTKAELRDEVLRERLKADLQKMFRSTGEVPNTATIKRAARAEETSSFKVYTRLFGDVNTAVRAALGDEILEEVQEGKKRLMELGFRAAQEFLGKTPSKTKLDAVSHLSDGRIPSSSQIRRVFGSLGALVQHCGFAPSKPGGKKKVEEPFGEGDAERLAAILERYLGAEDGHSRS
ncbi:hypothetical protein MRY87_09500 [bacterium]|nr:hypothetical protein [bacterium]